MTIQAKLAFEAVRAELDERAKKLAPLDYLDVLEELAGDVEAKIDCLRDEMKG